MSDDVVTNVTDEQSFNVGFLFASRLKDPDFRDWLKKQGYRDSSNIYVASQYRTVFELYRMIEFDAYKYLRLNPNEDRFRAFVALEDEYANNKYKFQIFEVTIRRD